MNTPLSTVAVFVCILVMANWFVFCAGWLVMLVMLFVSVPFNRFFTQQVLFTMSITLFPINQFPLVEFRTGYFRWAFLPCVVWEVEVEEEG